MAQMSNWKRSVVLAHNGFGLDEVAEPKDK